MIVYDVIWCYTMFLRCFRVIYVDLWWHMMHNLKKKSSPQKMGKMCKMCSTKQKKKIGSTKYFSVFFADPWSSDAQLSIAGVHSLNSQNWRNFTVEKKRPFFSPPHRRFRLYKDFFSHIYIYIWDFFFSYRREVVKWSFFWTFASRFWSSR